MARKKSEKNERMAEIFSSLKGIGAQALGTVLDDVKESAARRAAPYVTEALGQGMKAGKKALGPTLRLLSNLAPAVEKVARSMAEAEDFDWTAMTQEARVRWKDRAVNAIRGLEKYINE